MKKTIIGMALALAFTSQAEAKINEDVITLNIGTVENTETEINETVFGGSYFQAKGEDKFGLAYNLDLSINKTEVGAFEFDEKLIGHSIGFSYGLTNNLYIVPTIGLTYGEIKIAGFERTTWGGNIGTELVYQTDLGFVFGLGTRYHNVDLYDSLIPDANEFIQFHAKVGFSF